MAEELPPELPPAEETGSKKNYQKPYDEWSDHKKEIHNASRRALRRKDEKDREGKLDPEEKFQKGIDIELKVLEKQTRGNATDADGDIDFAYRNMALSAVRPLMAPSISAWSWYIYSRSEPNKFLEICAKREDAKAKMAGTITNQRMEDDKRSQFAVLDRLEKSMTMEVAAIVKELMSKYPESVLKTCREFDTEWRLFLSKDPTTMNMSIQ